MNKTHNKIKILLKYIYACKQNLRVNVQLQLVLMQIYLTSSKCIRKSKQMILDKLPDLSVLPILSCVLLGKLPNPAVFSHVSCFLRQIC